MAATVEVRLEYASPDHTKTIPVQDGGLLVGYGIMQGLKATWLDVWHTTPPDQRPERITVYQDGEKMAEYVFEDVPVPSQQAIGRG